MILLVLMVLLLWEVCVFFVSYIFGVTLRRVVGD
jgi:hypothetical protein